jgi:hypothetical protein
MVKVQILLVQDMKLKEKRVLEVESNDTIRDVREQLGRLPDVDWGRTGMVVHGGRGPFSLVNPTEEKLGRSWVYHGHPRLVCLFSPQADALEPRNLDHDKWQWYENDASHEPENCTYEPPTEIKLFYWTSSHQLGITGIKHFVRTEPSVRS